MGTNTPEYRAMIQSTSDLTNAVKLDIRTLSDELLDQGLIAADNQAAAINQMIDVGHRASRLVSLVRTKVQLNPSNFHKFVRILSKRASLYHEILEILDNKYRALGGVKDTGISAVLATLAEQEHGAAQQGSTVPKVAVASPIPPQNSAAQPVVVKFSPNLSDDEFVSYLRKEGLSAKDCEIMKENGIGAMTFATDFRAEDISSNELGFTFGGKKVLRRLLKDCSISTAADGQAIEPIEFNENDKKQISIDGGRLPVDYFEPYGVDRSTLMPVRFSFGVVTPKQGEKLSNVEEYNMSKSPHGIALIINNETFVKQDMRTGTAVDERHLTHAFRYLGYYVEVHREVDSQQMQAIMNEMGRRSHDNFDSFICCILSHGSAGYVFGTDSKEVSLNALTQAIDAKNCSSLHNKPKLFFLQACRGDLREMTVMIGADGDIRSTPQEIPQAADFFFGHATPQGHVAWRDFEHGSWYISELCYTLCEMSTFSSLNDIMTKVCSRVASGEKYKNIGGYRMTPEVTSRLQANVYF